jgi:succinyl-CoA synthetase alpha subunit
MSILVNKYSKVIVQGFTGKEGTFHSEQCIEYGTSIVAGVTPGKGGMMHLERPVFNTVAEAVEATGGDVSLIFVPPAFGADAILEAAESGIKIIICITEGIPVKDMILVKRYITLKGATLIGPNCPGVITAGESKIGIMPGSVFKKGKVGLISKSGTLTYEAANQIVKSGMGISTAIGIGGDPIIGTGYYKLLKLFADDPDTEAIVIIGEIGGALEMQAVDFIREGVGKPIVAFIAGQTAPRGKRMGHAGAIVSSGITTAQGKIKALQEAGVTVALSPAEIGSTLAEVLKIKN